MIYLELLLVYLKIGLFGFGGGYAMLSLIRDEVVRNKHWLTDQEFTDIIAISQMTPGPIGINSATYIGYEVAGIGGSVLATLAVMLPSFVLVYIISYSFVRFAHNKHVNAAFTGIRPAAIGLIAAAALMLCNSENFVDSGSLLFFAAAFYLSVSNKLHPILLIILSGSISFIVYTYINPIH